jgi:hypothetical protein
MSFCICLPPTGRCKVTSKLPYHYIFRDSILHFQKRHTHNSCVVTSPVICRFTLRPQLLARSDPGLSVSGGHGSEIGTEKNRSRKRQSRASVRVCLNEEGRPKKMKKDEKAR